MQPPPKRPPPLPHRQEIRRIQMIMSQLLLLSQPLPHPPPRRPPPLPHPPQQNNRRMIQIQLPPISPPLLLPHPQLFPQPQFVAVKSLIVLPPSFVYGLFYAWGLVDVSAVAVWYVKFLVAYLRLRKKSWETVWNEYGNSWRYRK